MTSLTTTSGNDDARVEKDGSQDDDPVVGNCNMVSPLEAISNVFVVLKGRKVRVRRLERDAE